MFADDAVLVAQNTEQLNGVIRVFQQFCNENGLAINSQKTEVMLLNCNGSVFCNDVALNAVQQFRYLGLIIDASAKSPKAMLEARMKAAKAAFHVLQQKCRVLDVYNCRVRAQLVQSLVVSHLTFGGVAWACMMSTGLSLGDTGTPIAQQCEVLLRKMLRWALHLPIDTRSSIIYILANCTTLQVLVFKKCLRYFNKLSTAPRFVTHFATAIQRNIDDVYLGPNTLLFWPQVKEFYSDQLKGVNSFYTLFKQLLVDDISSSQRLTQNGMSTIVRDMLTHCFRASYTRVPNAIQGICRRLVHKETAFVLHSEVTELGTTVQRVYYSHWPSWLTVGGTTVVQRTLTMLYGTCTHVRDTCPHCQQPLTHFWPHILSDCSQLVSIAPLDERWVAFCQLLRSGSVGLAVYAALPVLLRMWERLDPSQ